MVVQRSSATTIMLYATLAVLGGDHSLAAVVYWQIALPIALHG